MEKLTILVCNVVLDAYKGYLFGMYLIAWLLRSISDKIVKHALGIENDIFKF